VDPRGAPRLGVIEPRDDPTHVFRFGILASGIFFARRGLPLLLGGPYGEITDQRGTIAGSGGPLAPSGWRWQAAGEGGGSMDRIRKIERLQKLRESGAISDGEFQREKAKVLAEQ
jgi:Short C-terminal domain